MRKVIAALDNSSAAGPVLESASLLAQLLDADVEAIHVKEDGQRTADAVVAAARVPLRTLSGGTIDTLAEASAADDVVAVVIGARRTPAGARPLGATAFALAKSVTKPLLVVPPEVAGRPNRMQSVLVPLEGTISTSLAPRALIELARAAQLHVVIVHVRDEASLPSFTDQPHHEIDAWAHEFLARYCPSGVEDVHLDVRVGLREQEIVRAAEEHAADLIALGWSQELAADRASVVRAVLAWGGAAVLLIPVHFAHDIGPPQKKEESWNRSLSWRT